jgi:hypothetical protein
MMAGIGHSSMNIIATMTVRGWSSNAHGLALGILTDPNRRSRSA